ncbi:MAG: DUF6452 family protein [Bacteroidia bacterium]
MRLQISYSSHYISKLTAITPNGPVTVSPLAELTGYNEYEIFLNPADSISVFVIYQNNSTIFDTLVYGHSTEVRYENMGCGFAYTISNIRIKESTLDSSSIISPYYIMLP